MTGNTNNLILTYIIIINIISFWLRWLDKQLAISQKYRIPEKNLIYICILWWRIWWLIWSSLFKHKSSKISFWKRIYIISIIEIILFLIYSIYI